MTTNNHPANGPVSLDRLHQISEILSKASAQSDGGNLGYAMADAVKVIAGVIAAFGAEPVADVVAWSSPNGERTCDIRLRRHDIAPGPLYTTPPAPEVPEPATVETTYPDVQTNWEDAKIYADGWNACRAAMLQAGNSPVIGFDLASEPDRSVEVHYLAPPGYVMVPKKLTAESGAKGVLSGEFSETKFINCPECFGDDECETCDGSGQIEITVPVSWTNIKAIWAKGVEHCEAAPQQENV
ncbi:hypothetical protein OGX94_15365 [Citrobacter sp. Cpo037]|uniref:hypothetical protein n=1 Tax=Citrobacter sp. Cpo037 TaxID=2985125 RepID=UPI00257491AA|nr:hypothetical protein [Citrobacter sp. Cpo037]MDM2901902.1 hypothetical protein [Citrobacter sp. Cpo037]